MQNDIMDPIVYRNEMQTWEEAVEESSELLNQGIDSFLNEDELMMLENSGQTYLIITDDEVVDLKSNLLLPSGLRAYNSGETTYVEYVNSELSWTPELTTGQMEIIHWWFSSLLIWWAVLFLFCVLAVFLFRLLGWKWHK